MEVRNRFKGLDLIDRVNDEVWNEVRDIIQKTEIKTIPMEKKCKKAKWLSGAPGEITWTPRGNHVGPQGKSRGPPGAEKIIIMYFFFFLKPSRFF